MTVLYQSDTAQLKNFFKKVQTHLEENTDSTKAWSGHFLNFLAQ